MVQRVGPKKAKEFEGKVSTLEKENEKEKYKIEVLRDEYANREQRHEDKLAKLGQQHREEIARVERAAKEDITRRKKL